MSLLGKKKKSKRLYDGEILPLTKSVGVSIEQLTEISGTEKHTIRLRIEELLEMLAEEN